MNLKNRRIAFVASAIVSALLFWLYYGFYPLGTGSGIFPPAEGTLLNDVMRLVAIPLTLLLIVGGGIAVASALSDHAADDRRRTVLAIVTPFGIPWVFVIFPFMAGKSAEAIFFGIIIGGALLVPILCKIRQHRVLTH